MTLNVALRPPFLSSCVATSYVVSCWKVWNVWLKRIRINLGFTQSPWTILEIQFLPEHHKHKQAQPKQKLLYPHAKHQRHCLPSELILNEYRVDLDRIRDACRIIISRLVFNIIFYLLTTVIAFCSFREFNYIPRNNTRRIPGRFLFISCFAAVCFLRNVVHSHP